MTSRPGLALAFALAACVPAAGAVAQPPGASPLQGTPSDRHEAGAGAGQGERRPSGEATEAASVPPADRGPHAADDRADPRGEDGRGWYERTVAGLGALTISERLQAVFNGLLVLIGFLQWRVYSRQAKIMRTQAEIAGRTLDETATAAGAAKASAEVAERAMVYTQRAFLFSGTPAIDQVLLDGQVARMAVVVKWTNLGNTAARRMVARAEVLALPPEIPAGYEYPTKPWPNTEDPSATLAPKGEAVSDPILAPVEWFSLARRGEGQVCIIGWVEYNDVFPGTPRRRTEIFWRVAVKADPRIAVKDINECLALHRYGPHNGADEDCFHEPMT